MFSPKCVDCSCSSTGLLVSPLRTYPPKFGQKVAALRHRFIRSRTLWFGTHLLHDELTWGIQLFKSLPWSETDWWDDADMKPIFIYLRGARGLCLGSLRPLFPSEIQICCGQTSAYAISIVVFPNISRGFQISFLHEANATYLRNHLSCHGWVSDSHQANKCL